MSEGDLVGPRSRFGLVFNTIADEPEWPCRYPSAVAAPKWAAARRRLLSLAGGGCAGRLLKHIAARLLALAALVGALLHDRVAGVFLARIAATLCSHPRRPCRSDRTSARPSPQPVTRRNTTRHNPGTSAACRCALSCHRQASAHSEPSRCRRRGRNRRTPASRHGSTASSDRRHPAPSAGLGEWESLVAGAQRR